MPPGNGALGGAAAAGLLGGGVAVGLPPIGELDGLQPTQRDELAEFLGMIPHPAAAAAATATPAHDLLPTAMTPLLTVPLAVSETHSAADTDAALRGLPPPPLPPDLLSQPPAALIKSGPTLGEASTSRPSTAETVETSPARAASTPSQVRKGSD